MSDNTILPPGGGGDTIRTIDHASTKTQVVALDFGGEAGPEALVTSSTPLPVTVSNLPATQPVSGTVTTTPPSNATTNVTQFGGTVISTGTGVGGAGIPRVTISSDSFPATQTVSGTINTNPPANASTNVTQFGGTNVATGTGTGGAGIPRVTVSSDSFPASQPVSGTITVQQATAANLNATVTGTVTSNQGGAPWTVKPDGTVWTLTGTSANANITNTVAVSGTVTTTPPSNASTNVAQFGGTNVATGTGVSGAGIPRVTVSSDSFPATQPVSGSISISNFPTNTVQETGGNLSLLVTLTTTMTQLVELNKAILSTLEAIRLQAATTYGVDVSPAGLGYDGLTN